MQQGDPMMPKTDEFCTLLEQSIPHLRAYGRSLTHNADAADDLVQDALVRAWAARGQFQPGTNFKAWAFTILRNRFLDQRRRDRGSNESIDDLRHDALVARPAQDVVVQFDDMARAFWRLNPHHREILMLVGANGLSYEEAANVIGCAVGTVRSRLSRARTELQSVIERGRVGTDQRRSSGEFGAVEFLRALAAA
jgi:RNA polymerase sigma-70 factor (ECF subfamily)